MNADMPTTFKARLEQQRKLFRDAAAPLYEPATTDALLQMLGDIRAATQAATSSNMASQEVDELKTCLHSLVHQIPVPLAFMISESLFDILIGRIDDDGNLVRR